MRGDEKGDRGKETSRNVAQKPGRDKGRKMESLCEERKRKEEGETVIVKENLAGRIISSKARQMRKQIRKVKSR